MTEEEDLIATLEAIVWVTCPRRAVRLQRVRALCGQMARATLQKLRRPRLISSQTAIRAKQ